ncbi:MAG TPA: NAD(P)/FAD-dependent oxidoreductase [Chthoniobacterales bacterium]|nr:NAD(P)/FAD-dependent oxidoreductase [Chthoniobacterales bacterium]
MKKNRVLILGGGFGGLYAALEFEKRHDPDFEVTLISQDNFFLFTPMLHEVAASDLDLTHIVNPIRKMLRRVHFFEGEVRSIDITKRQVVVAHGFDQHTHTLEYDHVVFALGCVTNFYNIPRLAEIAVTMKSLGDAIGLRNRLIEHLEEADTECAANDREPLLTFVVAGGGFAGVETIGSINDFLREALPYYPNLKPEMIRVVLVHPGEFVLPELGEALGRYANRKLAERGVEIRPNTKIKAVTSNGVELTDGTEITARTLVWTAGTSPHPLLEKLPLPKERQRLKVNGAMGVEGHPGIWALGDCAMIPNEQGGYQPPTAQHASREGKVLAHNIVANSRGKDLIPFRFNTLGLLASIGRRTGVARILGVNFSGFVAWWLWRTIYLLKLPRAEKKVRVALDWTLDVFFSKDFVQYLHERSALVVNTPIANCDARPIGTDPLLLSEVP